MSDSNTGDLIAGIKENTKTEVIKLKNPVEGAPDIEVIAHSKGDRGVGLQGTKEFFDAYRTKPEIIRGTSTHTEVDSFVNHINRFKDASRSVYFADRSALTLTAIYDYHTKYGEAENLAHKARFAPKKSRQLVTWTETNAQPLNQGKFAAFVENNILDLCDAPADAESIAMQLGTTIASPSRLLELARGLSIHEASSVKSHVNTSTGEVTLEYITAHSDGNGKKLSLPGLFCIGIPVFEGGLPYRVLVRLRYRIAEGKAVWWYELYQLDARVDDAFDAIIKTVSEDTGLQLYRGSAEQ